MRWLLISVLFLATTVPSGPNDPPELLDRRLTLRIFAENPDIATPIGIAVDSLDRVFVLESHTHQPGSDYPGPKTDRIKIFEDADGYGVVDKHWVFAKDIQDGMNIAFGPSGALYLVTSKQVWALHDKDGDGISESRDLILRMIQPESVHDHAGLLGLTFSPDGWLYVSRGNVDSQGWLVAGSDGTLLKGYGDGGNIMRCRPDGTGLEEVSTGYWNPFDMKFDRQGRLLVIDNDPAERGPNRLVHAVPGSDFGYRSLYGGSGVHPFGAWNGELPGTLPYAAELGEAPSGLLDASGIRMPPDYEQTMLVTIWEESRIDRINFVNRGSSILGTTRPIIKGSPSFRPVAMAHDSRGSIYITDWVVRQYPNHGKGRIWRLRPDDPTPQGDPDRQPAEFLPTYSGAEELIAAVASNDRFARHAAIIQLRDSAHASTVSSLIASENPRDRATAIEILLPQSPDPNLARTLLADPDPRVRQSTLLWIGRHNATQLASDLATAIETEPVTAELFQTWLGTLQEVNPDYVSNLRDQAELYSNRLVRSMPDGLFEDLLADDSLPAAVRAIAVKFLPESEDRDDLLLDIARADESTEVRLEAIRSLRRVIKGDITEALYALALSKRDPTAVRAEAINALGYHPVSTQRRRRLLDFASSQVLETAVTRIVDRPDPTGPRRPQADSAWRSRVVVGGDPEAGERAFFSAQSQCSQCHRFDGRGKAYGPDLSSIGASKGRMDILDSILNPSDTISPEWQAWLVTTTDDSVHIGRQIDVGLTSVKIQTRNQGFRTFENVADYRMAPFSLMPEGLESGLTVAEMRDLLAFLERAGSTDP